MDGKWRAVVFENKSGDLHEHSTGRLKSQTTNVSRGWSVLCGVSACVCVCLCVCLCVSVCVNHVVKRDSVRAKLFLLCL